MKITTLTGAEDTRESGVLRISKSFGAILLITNVHPSTMTDETIRLFIETAKGNNIDVTKEGTPLNGFVGLTTFGEGAIQKVGERYFSRCELSSASFELGDDDTCKLEIKNIKVGNEITVHTLEYPEFSTDIAYIENKVFTTDEKERTFKVDDNDLVMLTNVDIVRKVQFHWDNGITTDYEIDELRAISLDADQLATIGSDETGGLFSTENLLLPLVGVSAISITKVKGVCEILYLDFEETEVY